jgi:hypothetical protein
MRTIRLASPIRCGNSDELIRRKPLAPPASPFQYPNGMHARLGLTPQKPVQRSKQAPPRLRPAAQVRRCGRIIEFEQLHEYAIRGGDHHVTPIVVFSQSVRGKNPGPQTRPDVAEVRDPDPKMMDRTASIVPGGLIINMQASCPDRQKDVSRPSQALIENDLGVQMPRPPFDCRVDVACEYMNMVKIDWHASFFSIVDHVGYI